MFFSKEIEQEEKKHEIIYVEDKTTVSAYYSIFGIDFNHSWAGPSYGTPHYFSCRVPFHTLQTNE